MTQRTILRIDALALADGDGFCASPAAVLLQLPIDRRTPPRREPLARLLAAGTPRQIDAHPASLHARRFLRPHSVLVPGLVNSHAHLDLTHLGPQPHEPDQGFVAWVDRLRTGRAVDEDDIAASVQRGIALSLAGGVVAVGDIAGCPATGPTLAPWRVLAASDLLGVSYLEFFAIGSGYDSRLARVSALLERTPAEAFASPLVRLGLQPHAPNTVEPRGYAWAAQEAHRFGGGSGIPDAALPLATHLAETPEERQFIAEATGDQRAMLERFGLWEPRLASIFGRALTPAQHLRPFLEAAHPLVAHVNDCPDSTLQILAETGASVAYCPRASAYFAAERHFGPHRYRDMLAAGVNVCLGTDSILNLPLQAAEAETGGMSILDEVRLLSRRDSTDARLLLRMATLNGASALGLEQAWFRFGGGEHPIAGVVAVEAPEGGDGIDHIHNLVAGSTGAPEVLLNGKKCCLPTTCEPSET